MILEGLPGGPPLGASMRLYAADLWTRLADAYCASRATDLDRVLEHLEVFADAVSTPSACTCPPVADVLRGRANDTRPECPLHPTPNFAPGTFLPAVKITGPYAIFSAPEPSSTAAAAHDEERLDGEPRS